VAWLVTGPTWDKYLSIVKAWCKRNDFLVVAVAGVAVAVAVAVAVGDLKYEASGIR